MTDKNLLLREGGPFAPQGDTKDLIARLRSEDYSIIVNQRRMQAAATALESQAQVIGRLRTQNAALRAALRSVNAVAIERGDKFGACDQIDNHGDPYQSQWLAELLAAQESATVQGDSK